MNRFDSSKVDLASIRRLYNDNPTARAILDNFANRKKISRETTVAAIFTDLPRHGYQHKLTHHQIVEVLEKLGAYGCGRLVQDNNVLRTKLVWNENVSMKDIGRVASQEDSAGARKIQTEHNVGIPAGRLISHTYRLRSDYPPIKIELPEDFTRTEANRVADFIKTLPIES